MFYSISVAAVIVAGATTCGDTARSTHQGRSRVVATSHALSNHLLTAPVEPVPGPGHHPVVPKRKNPTTKCYPELVSMANPSGSTHSGPDHTLHGYAHPSNQSYPAMRRPKLYGNPHSPMGICSNHTRINNDGHG
ncbi:hypothetical protein B0T17DRAFT_519136 [Bombardia bombarda]|uniref:Secreted protein n=1 Tax=Bombardia bombarda TaxID=252184 RepID=A0AA39XML6_9PEZI|nr:hypothetical protein B0T17DRAFT_519136 [Bombardia bombarda]